MYESIYYDYMTVMDYNIAELRNAPSLNMDDVFHRLHPNELMTVSTPEKKIFKFKVELNMEEIDPEGLFKFLPDEVFRDFLNDMMEWIISHETGNKTSRSIEDIILSWRATAETYSIPKVVDGFQIPVDDKREKVSLPF